jgi:two-component system phosphate regulon sensor histidine kinase PhoR
MSVQHLDTLAAIIKKDRDVLLGYWRDKVRKLPSAKNLDTPTLNDHMPSLLDELAAAFQHVFDQTMVEALLVGSPPSHGRQRFQDGFDIVEVVAEYNILRSCIYDHADRCGVTVHGKAFHILNRVIDEAIGLAVQTFATHQALEMQRRREEYLSFVAHDLRTPLNAISLAASVLEIAVPKQDGSVQTDRMVKTLQRNTRQLQDLIEKILKENDHIQTETGIKLERRKFDLWPQIEALIHDLHPIAGTASTTLVNQVPEELTVYADASLLKRVFQNLIANAIKYTPRGSINIGAKESGTDGAVECWVSDDGSGVPADRLAVIFDKHETDGDRDDGTGLGLAIVKMFVEAHGGTVAVESSEGVGSTFTFTLPGKPKPGA